MKITLYHQAINEQMELDTRYKLARRMLNISKYERMKNMSKRPIIIRKSPDIPSYVTQEQKEYIRVHVGKVPRSKLAHRVGLSKVDLNNTIIGMGLSKERVEDRYDEKSA